MPDNGDQKNDWLDLMSEEDLAFLKRFVMASGSLKAVASQYGISYPTVRLRLDRLIEKVKLAEDSRVRSDFELILRAQHADGQLDATTLKTLLNAYRDEQETDE